MKKTVLPICIVLVTGIILNCSGGRKLVENNFGAPDWYLNTPEESNYMFGIGEGESPDLSLARVSAEAAARDDISNQINIKVTNMIRRSKQQVGQDLNLNVIQNVGKQISIALLHGCKIDQRQINKQDNGKYKAYALAKYSLENAKKSIKNMIKNKEYSEQLEMNEELQKILNEEIEKLTVK